MTLLAQLAAFCLGVYLSIRLIAALYGILDLWYAIGSAYPRVMRSVVGWGAVTAVAAWLLGPSTRAALVSGLLGFLAFYLSLYALRGLLLRALQRR